MRLAELPHHRRPAEDAVVLFGRQEHTRRTVAEAELDVLRAQQRLPDAPTAGEREPVVAVGGFQKEKVFARRQPEAIRQTALLPEFSLASKYSPGSRLRSGRTWPTDPHGLADC